MDQDWVTVVLKRRAPAQPTVVSSAGRSRAAVVDGMDYSEAPKKRVMSESLQELIRCRMERKLTQDKADQLCHFPRHTIKGIESRRMLPSTAQQQAIQKHFGVQLKIEIA